MYSATLRVPAFLSAATIACTHRPTHSGGAATLVRVAGPGAIVAPEGRVPSPASGRHGSVFPWAPNTETGKENDVVSLATQPIIGTVSAPSAPWAAFSAKKSVYAPLGRFSKYQSCARLIA